MSAVQLQDGWVMWSCDHPMCEETVEFRPTLEDTAKIEVRPTPGEAGPEDWVLHLPEASAQPAGPRHLCPTHAGAAER